MKQTCRQNPAEKLHTCAATVTLSHLSKNRLTVRIGCRNAVVMRLLAAYNLPKWILMTSPLALCMIQRTRTSLDGVLQSCACNVLQPNSVVTAQDGVTC